MKALDMFDHLSCVNHVPFMFCVYDTLKVSLKRNYGTKILHDKKFVLSEDIIMWYVELVVHELRV